MHEKLDSIVCIERLSVGSNDSESQINCKAFITLGENKGKTYIVLSVFLTNNRFRSLVYNVHIATKRMLNIKGKRKEKQ